MTINTLIQQWNINVPKDTYLFEHLLKANRSNCFFVDKLPLEISLENHEKFDQIDISYQEVLEGKVSQDDFLQIEKRYRNVMTKLWLYNKLYVELDLETVNGTTIHGVVEPKYEQFVDSITGDKEELKLIEIHEKEQLEFWVQIGIRDAAFPIFYFENFKLLLVPSWSCYIAYLHDLSKLHIIRDIVMSEGLFVRLSEVDTLEDNEG